MRKSSTLLLLLLVFACWCGTTTVVAAEDDNGVVQSMADDLSYDENGKLIAHTLLFTKACGPDISDFQVPALFDKRQVAGSAQAMVFGDADPTECHAVCIERGVDRNTAHAAMPHKYYPNNPDKLSFNDWFQMTCMRVEVCVMNYHSKTTPIKLMWFHPDKKKFQLHLEIEYGERNTRCFKSFIGHQFEALDGQTEEPIQAFSVEFVTTLAIGVSPPSGDPDRHDFTKEIERTLKHEWTRHNSVKRTFSPLGFQKGRLPDDVFASMSSFYYNNRNYKVREEWNNRGVFVNWWESNCSFIQIPWELKGMWQERLRLLVEAWAGVDIEQTDMYGLRQYEQGARLLTHVDREATHAVSLIVNVAQGNLTSPWPVEVFDHADRLHEVLMEPGDVVYYESAHNLHSRNRPLQGKDAYYVNLFTHYRPIPSREKWMHEPSREGTPEPVLDVEGSCRLETSVGTTAESSSPQQQLSTIQTVHCDDPRLGRTISPTLFTAKNGDDLIHWWRYTGGLENELRSSGEAGAFSGREEL